MSLDLKEAILKAEDRRYEDVRVAEWNATVRVAEIDAGMRLEYQKRVTRMPKRENEQPTDEWFEWFADVKFFLLVNSLVDPKDWQPVFTMDEVASLKGKAQRVLDPLYEKALELSTLSGKAMEEAKGE